jgi:hypothetical protein
MPLDGQRQPIVGPILTPKAAHGQQPVMFRDLNRTPNGARRLIEAGTQAVAGIWWPVNPPSQLSIPCDAADQLDQGADAP